MLAPISELIIAIALTLFAEYSIFYPPTTDYYGRTITQHQRKTIKIVFGCLFLLPLGLMAILWPTGLNAALILYLLLFIIRLHFYPNIYAKPPISHPKYHLTICFYLGWLGISLLAFGYWYNLILLFTFSLANILLVIILLRHVTYSTWKLPLLSYQFPIKLFRKKDFIISFYITVLLSGWGWFWSELKQDPFHQSPLGPDAIGVFICAYLAVLTFYEYILLVSSIPMRDGKKWQKLKKDICPLIFSKMTLSPFEKCVATDLQIFLANQYKFFCTFPPQLAWGANDICPDFMLQKKDQRIIGKKYQEGKELTFCDLQKLLELKSRYHATKILLMAMADFSPGLRSFICTHQKHFIVIAPHLARRTLLVTLFCLYLLLLLFLELFFSSMFLFPSSKTILLSSHTILIGAYLVILAFAINVLKVFINPADKELKKYARRVQKLSANSTTEEWANLFKQYFMAQNFLVLPNPEAKNGDFDFTIVKDQQIFLGKLAPQIIDLATVHALWGQKTKQHADQVILFGPKGINPDAQAFVDQHGTDCKILTPADLVRPIQIGLPTSRAQAA